MVNSLYRFSDVEAQNPTPDCIREAIRSVLVADGDACYMDMEPYLMAPGVCGSRFFDQALAVETLLKHDREGEGRIAKLMTEKPTLVRRGIWDELQKVLRKAGFKIKHGRVAGLLENRETPEDENESGQPDID